jgi:hypothetical protein
MTDRTDRTGKEHTMKRTATILGVLAALAVPSVASAGNVTAQARLQVSAHGSQMQVLKTEIVRAQIARTQVSAAKVSRARVVRGQVAKLQVVRPLGTKIVLHRMLH